jgi:hypothetical protein
MLLVHQQHPSVEPQYAVGPLVKCIGPSHNFPLVSKGNLWVLKHYLIRVGMGRAGSWCKSTYNPQRSCLHAYTAVLCPEAATTQSKLMSRRFTSWASRAAFIGPMTAWTSLSLRDNGCGMEGEIPCNTPLFSALGASIFMSFSPSLHQW